MRIVHEREDVPDEIEDFSALQRHHPRASVAEVRGRPREIRGGGEADRSRHHVFLFAQKVARPPALGDVELVGRTSRWLRYRLPARYIRRNQRPVCIGQKQRWFLLRLRRADVRGEE